MKVNKQLQQQEQTRKFKGIVHPKIKILSQFTHAQVVPNKYEFLCSAEHKRKIFGSMFVTKQIPPNIFIYI